MDPFIGQLIMFAGNFAPRGWALCQGQLLAISQYQALFSILGTTYGGDGRTTFALPDLRGRVPRGSGDGPGLSSIRQGERSGQEQVTLSAAQMPQHSHSLTNNATSNGADSQTAAGNFPATTQAPAYAEGPGNVTTGSNATGTSGGNSPVPIVDPFLGMNYIVALEGSYPARN